MARTKGVVLYIMAGRGHLAPALAIAEGLGRMGCDAEAVDFFRLMRAPVWARLLRWVWRLYLRFPDLERRSQLRIEGRRVERFVLDRIRFLYTHRFRAWYLAHQPDFIVTTNLVPAWLVSGYIDDLSLPLRLVAYNSDVFSAHGLYVCRRIRLYLSPEPGASMLIEKGQPADSVFVSPVPLRRVFTENKLFKTEARRSLGLTDRFTLLLSLGGEGIGSLAIVEELGRRQAQVQIVVIGKGRAGRESVVRSVARRFPTLILVDAGFVEEPCPYVVASDLVAGKAGANTVCEALSLRRPFLITTAYHNIESTISFLAAYGVAWLEPDPACQAQLVLRLSESGRLSEPRQDFDALPMSFGAEAFAELVLRLLGPLGR